MIFDAFPLPDYPEPYGLLCAILQDGTREWRNEMDSDLSEDAMVWRPLPDTQSIGTTLLHIVGVEIYWFERVALDLAYNFEEVKLTLMQEIDVDAGQWPEPPRQALSWYFDLHDRIRARTLERIKTWPPADEPGKADGDPPTLRWILGHVIQHEAYHGGQAVLLNRLRQKAEANT